MTETAMSATRNLNDHPFKGRGLRVYYAENENAASGGHERKGSGSGNFGEAQVKVV